MSLAISRNPNLTNQITSLDDLFNREYVEREISFNEDPLVLACIVKDRYETTGNFTSLNDSVLISSITDKHRQLAEKIRDYYTKKFFWRLFKNDLSDYRKRLCFLLENRIRSCKEKDTGIYCKLPWFYEEDMIYDEIKKSVETSKQYYVNTNGTAKQVVNLTFLKKTLSFQKRRKIERFWFKEDNELYCIEAEASSIFLELFKSLVERNQPLTLDSRKVADYIDTMWFYKLYDFTLTKE